MRIHWSTIAVSRLYASYWTQIILPKCLWAVALILIMRKLIKVVPLSIIVFVIIMCIFPRTSKKLTNLLAKTSTRSTSHKVPFKNTKTEIFIFHGIMLIVLNTLVSIVIRCQWIELTTLKFATTITYANTQSFCYVSTPTVVHVTHRQLRNILKQLN